MKNFRRLFSYSFRDYGDHVAVFLDDMETPLFLGSHTDSDMAEACRVLAAELLESAHQFDHAKDFCAPEFDKEHREKQIEELRGTMEAKYD